MRDKIDFDLLSKFPIRVVGYRQNDDLECAVCLEYGPIVIIEIQDCTYDICNRCVAAAKVLH
jgi:hypothetical protein